MENTLIEYRQLSLKGASNFQPPYRRPRTPAALPTIFAEPHLLELALVNLSTNARDAMPHGGTFTIEAAEERVAQEDQDVPTLKSSDYVRLYASDTGSGMNEQTIARATEPLFTTKRAKKAQGSVFRW